MLDEATMLKPREENWAPKKPRTWMESIAGMTDASIRHHFALWNASFTDGQGFRKVLADQRSNVNLLPQNVLTNLLKLGKYEIKHFQKPRIYKTVSGSVCSRFEKKITLLAVLKIGHGSSLFLCNVTLKIPNKAVRHAIIGRHDLESIGYDNKSMMEASIAPHPEEIDLKTFMKEESNSSDGSTTALIGD